MSDTQLPSDQKVSPFKVGDRIRPTNLKDGAHYVPATVTEITERGFKYRHDSPICIHPFFGSYQDGECFSPHLYELMEQPCQSK